MVGRFKIQLLVNTSPETKWLAANSGSLFSRRLHERNTCESCRTSCRLLSLAAVVALNLLQKLTKVQRKACCRVPRTFRRETGLCLLKIETRRKCLALVWDVEIGSLG
jgi:hypothetical protein